MITPLAFPARSIAAPVLVPGVPSTLPLPVSPPLRTSTAVYSLTTIDVSGRATDQTIMDALGWPPGTGVNVQVVDGLLAIRSADPGTFHVTRNGRLSVPATVSRQCGLEPGNPALLAAYPDHDLLVIHPPARLDTLLAAHHAPLLGGEPS